MHYAPRSLSRRHFLHASGAGIGLLALAGIESQVGADTGSFPFRARNVILLSMPSGACIDKLYPQVAQHKQDLLIASSLDGAVPAVELAAARQDSPGFVTMFDTRASDSFGSGVGGLRLRDAGAPVLESWSSAFMGGGEREARLQFAAFQAANVESEMAPITNLYALDDDDRRLASFGRKCLIARRLVERGVSFVQISAPEGAAGGISAATEQDRARWTDRPIAALLTDLRQRGMLASTLIIWANVSAGASPHA